MKAVIFDLDNTLEEWLPFENEVEEIVSEELSEQYGFAPDVFKRIFDSIKVSYLYDRSIPQDFGRDIWFSETFAHFGHYDVDVKPFVQRYWDLLLPRVKLFPGTLELLEELKGRYKLAILTDSDGEKKWKLKRIEMLGIRDLFDVILTSDDVGANKPHPRCFLRVVEELQVRPSECFMVGDRPEGDLVMAKELGMTTIWTREGLTGDKRDRSYPYVDHIVDRITEVRDIVLETAPQIRH